MTTLTQQRIETLQEARQAVDLNYKEEDGFRHHLGASQIGMSCARKLWYVFRHAKQPHFEARMIRLFNRGHLEEQRFTSMLRSIGVRVEDTDANGNQFRISDCRGHFGGSSDGAGFDFPEYPGEWALIEYKTHGSKSFATLIKSGVLVAKPQHYSQMQVYMFKLGLKRAFYMAVNKDTDEIYTEWIYLDEAHAKEKLDLAQEVIFGEHLPDRVSDLSTYYECRWCEYRSLCFHKGDEPHRNCRTCKSSYPSEDGKWGCEYNGCSDIDYKNPCSAYEKHVVFMRPKDVVISL